MVVAVEMSSANRRSSGPRVHVVCGELFGLLNVKTLTIEIPNHNTRVSPADFERLAGRGLCKKWKNTIKVYDPASREADMSLSEWAAMHEIKLGKCSLTSASDPNQQKPARKRRITRRISSKHLQQLGLDGLGDDVLRSTVVLSPNLLQESKVRGLAPHSPDASDDTTTMVDRKRSATQEPPSMPSKLMRSSPDLSGSSLGTYMPSPVQADLPSNLPSPKPLSLPAVMPNSEPLHRSTSLPSPSTRPEALPRSYSTNMHSSMLPSQGPSTAGKQHVHVPISMPQAQARTPAAPKPSSRPAQSLQPLRLCSSSPAAAVAASLAAASGPKKPSSITLESGKIVSTEQLQSWVLLLGGCREITKCSGWGLVAAKLELPPSTALEVQQGYICELLHLEADSMQALGGDLHLQLHRQPDSQQPAATPAHQASPFRNSGPLASLACSGVHIDADESIRGNMQVHDAGQQGKACSTSAMHSLPDSRMCMPMLLQHGDRHQSVPQPDDYFPDLDEEDVMSDEHGRAHIFDDFLLGEACLMEEDGTAAPDNFMLEPSFLQVLPPSSNGSRHGGDVHSVGTGSQMLFA
jgi:hypothetical protein